MNDSQLTDKELAILDAAEAEFILKGFVGARTTQIAARAGVTHAMLHYYFRSKNRLFELVLERKSKNIAAMLFVNYDSEACLEDRIKLIAQKHFDFVLENRPLATFILREIMTNDAMKENFIQNIKDRISSYLVKIQNELNEQTAQLGIEPIDAFDLLYTIVTVNISSILLGAILPIEQSEEFWQERKKVNVGMILSRLKK